MKRLDMDKEELNKRLKFYEKKYGPYIEKRGLSNWKNLFVKPNNYEWTILFMLLMAGFIGWAYITETAQCRETLGNIEVICLNYCERDIPMQNYPYSEVNLSQFIIKADNESLDDNN